MDFNKFLLAVFSLVFTLTVFPLVVPATTSVTVTSPNGGEFVSGNYPINWTFSDTTNSQNVDFNLWYSYAASSNNFSIIQDLNFAEYCDTELASFWGNSDTNYSADFASPLDVNVGSIDTFEYGGETYFSYSKRDGLDLNVTDFNTFQLSGGTWVDVSTDFNLYANMPCDDGGCTFKIFEKDGELYMISVFGDVSGTSIFSRWNGYKLVGSNWEDYPAIVGGLSNVSGTNAFATLKNMPFEVIILDGDYYIVLIVDQSGNTPWGHKTKGWVWNGTAWTSYAPIASFDGIAEGLITQAHIPAYASSITQFEYLENPKLLIGGISTSGGSQTVIYAYDFNGTTWTKNPDLNKGFSLPSVSNNDIALTSFETLNEWISVFGLSLSTRGKTQSYSRTLGVNNSYSFGQPIYDTLTTSNCTYNWDTTGALNGNWFIDLQGIGSTTATDSSNASFLISNYSSSDLQITPIKNIDSVSYDANGARLTYSNVPDEMIWKSKNNSIGAINPRYILNGYISSDKIGFVYTSTNGDSWTFSDTLTFGSTVANPVQKIWDANNNRYDFSFAQTLTSGSEKYYKVKFESVPFTAINLRNNDEWVLIPTPSTYTQEGSTHGYDLFNDSNYTNLQIYSKQKFSELTASSGLNAGYELQFTAFADEAGTINAGYRVDGTDTTSDVPITTTKRRYSIPINTNDFDAYLIVKSTNTTSNRYYFSDWAIVPRSYFASRLELFDADGTAPKVIVRDTNSFQYIQESDQFRFDVEAFDKDLDLRELRIDVFLGEVIVNTYSYDLTGYGKNISFNELSAGVTDYNGAALINETLQPLRDLTVRATLINDNDENVAEQYQTIKLLQYPYFPTDLDFFISPLTHKVGNYPSFSFVINQKKKEPFIGLEIKIYDSSHSVSSPNYETIVYAEDLGCDTLISCSKQIILDDTKYSSGTYTLSVGALLKTEPQNYTNPLTNRNSTVVSSYVDVETARILQVFERSTACGGAAQYLDTEQIPLVFQVRTDTLENMGKEFTAYLSIKIHDGATVSDQNTIFYPDKFIYDELTGYNYWYWTKILYDDSGNLLPDGNSISFDAFLIPVGETSEATSAYGLTNKCDSYPSDFFCGSFLMNWIGFVGDATFGCTDTADAIVATASGTTIDINTNYVPRALQNHSVFCIRTDESLEFSQELGDDFTCAVLYLKSEEQLDKFDVYLSNQYSDYSLTGNEAQYIKFSIDQPTVMFNDILMLRSALATEFDTSEDIHTLGQLLAAGFNKILPYGQGIVDYAQWLAGEGYIVNAGADLNLENQLSPDVVSGIFFFKVTGMSVLNQYDYVNDYPELELLNPVYFRRFANDAGIDLPIKSAIIRVYDRDFKVFQSFKVDSPLVIFETPSEAQRNLQDTNYNEISVVPASLKFNFVVDMFSANETKGVRAFVPLVFAYIVPAAPLTFASILAGATDFLQNPVQWIFSNWFILLMALILLLVVSLIYANFRKGGVTIVNQRQGG